MHIFYGRQEVFKILCHYIKPYQYSLLILFLLQIGTLKMAQQLLVIDYHIIRIAHYFFGWADFYFVKIIDDPIYHDIGLQIYLL